MPQHSASDKPIGNAVPALRSTSVCDVPLPHVQARQWLPNSRISRKVAKAQSNNVVTFSLFLCALAALREIRPLAERTELNASAQQGHFLVTCGYAVFAAVNGIDKGPARIRITETDQSVRFLKRA